MASSEGRKRGGQPKPPEERKRNNLTFRARDELREQIRISAEASGRSVSEEIEHRLELSLARAEQIQADLGEDIFRIARAMASSLTHIQDWKDKTWIDDDETYSLFCGTTCELIRNYRDRVLKNRRNFPRGDLNKMPPEEQVQYFAALGGLAPPRPPVEIIVTDED
ncbi:Arc family DNA-binding protein [Methylobacterium goesingense]|uniref:Arc-like DNA binding domain-containing protein n=1 Tax=Methylobacterium goesingense TaxID=243690 RepID=A0ABV2L9P9_9HYPH|nr:Arc family DNA-binding protein [Methylobacterium goesingense]